MVMYHKDSYNEDAEANAKINHLEAGMQINEVIKKYRKENHLTQEEMANRLGVTAPDISLLAPIARLLHISLDELLSFKENLSEIEVANIIKDIDARFEREPFGDVFVAIENLVREYPNSELLMFSLACLLDSHRIVQGIKDEGKYDPWIQRCYERLLDSRDGQMKRKAAECLYSFFMRKEQYEKAEKYLEYFSVENPERKRKLAAIYSATGRFTEAYKTFEETVFSEYQIISGALHGIYMIAMKTEDYEKAEYILEKVSGLSRLFDMGEFSSISGRLDYAVALKDAPQALQIMERLLETMDSLTEFTRSKLFEHMDFKESDPKFMGKIMENLLEQFRSDDAYGFVRESPQWKDFTDSAALFEPHCE